VKADNFACNGIGMKFDHVMLMERCGDNGYQTESARQYKGTKHI
jgi:hypothetical protein